MALLVLNLMLGALAGCGHHGDLADSSDVAPIVVADDHGVRADPETIAAEAVVVPQTHEQISSQPQSEPLYAAAHAPQRIALAAGPGSAFGDQPHMSPRSVAEVDAPYLMDAGDKIRIFVYGQPNLSRIYTVDGSGFVAIPLIGAVKARGETAFDLERAVTVQLGAKYVKEPKVSVEVATYRPFFILGEVRSSGQYPYVSGMTVETAVAIAGGYSERANERRVQITRRVNGMVEKALVPGDTVVQPGDTIHVRERFF